VHSGKLGLYSTLMANIFHSMHGISRSFVGVEAIQHQKGELDEEVEPTPRLA
jgi:hypothetical protein